MKQCKGCYDLYHRIEPRARVGEIVPSKRKKALSKYCDSCRPKVKPVQRPVYETVYVFNPIREEQFPEHETGNPTMFAFQ